MIEKIDLYDYKTIYAFSSKFLKYIDPLHEIEYNDERNVEVDYCPNFEFNDVSLLDSGIINKICEKKIIKGSPYDRLSNSLYNDDYFIEEFESEGFVRGPSQSYLILVN